MSDTRPVIAHLLHQLQFAGAEVLAADLSRRMKDRYRFVMFCLDGLGKLAEHLAAEGFAVVDLGRRPGIDWQLGRRLNRALREHHVQLVHAHQCTPFFYAALSRGLSSSPPILFTEHGRHYPDVRKWRRIVVNRLLLRKSDRVTAVGQFVKAAVVRNEGLPAARIEVIYNGVDPAMFDVSTDRAIARQSLGLKPNESVVLQVARFHPVKDHATALRAMKHVEATLLLVGNGQQRAAAKALADELGIAGRVKFLGVRTDIAALMAAADVFLLSSLSEGISVTLLEAMASRLPIVTTDVGGNSEVVTHNVTGLLAPRSDASALAAHLNTLLADEDLRKQFGWSGRQRLLEQFTQADMHAAYAQVYESLISPISS